MNELEIVRLADYEPPAFTTLHHDLTFDLQQDHTLVTHNQQFKRIQASVDENGWAVELQKHLELDGEGLELIEIAINDKALSDNQWRYENNKLTLFNVADEFTLTTKVKIYPDDNKELSGLYRSNGVYCTQCEAQGFRRISFAQDRPDVLATYRVRIESDSETAPVQLSNGNLEVEGTIDAKRHFSEWTDPHPKPTYLFALVAGDLEQVNRRITTPLGKKIDLRIYTEAAFIEQTDFAMQSLIESIKWDEERFNLSYDLERFNIVAVSDFNMGAMENKGLNIFNTRYVLADTETATDEDFHGIRSVIGHEYFHNWTGNRITCRDWFQLSLKEGLTVFRDQEFSADMGERSIERIADVNRLRRAQFPEDAGPMAHPVRPTSYAAIDNFYTATVYEKGAEIIRMMHTIIGEEAFQKGMALYVERHDGQAVRIEEFAQCMQDASGFDFRGLFFNWYTTSGTPHVQFTSSYNQRERTFTLSAGQQVKKVNPESALLIPIRISLLSRNGRQYKFEDGSFSQLLLLDNRRGSWVFEHADSDLIPVIMHGFTAPIRYEHHYEDEELAVIVNHAKDGFARYEAMQRCFLRLFEQSLKQPKALVEGAKKIGKLCQEIIDNTQRSAQEKALLLALPSINDVMGQFDAPVDMDAITNAYERVLRLVALKIRLPLTREFEAHPQPEQPRYSVKDAGERALRGLCIHYLSVFNEPKIRQWLFELYEQANCMTERMNALQGLNRYHDDWRSQALDEFSQRFADYPLVMDKWFALQARYEGEDTLTHLEKLVNDARFDLTNPNRFRALVGTFAQQNLLRFHHQDGSGYRFVASQIRRILGINPQLSARLLNVFASVAKLDEARQQMVAQLLRELLTVESISVDAREVIERILSGLK